MVVVPGCCTLIITLIWCTCLLRYRPDNVNKWTDRNKAVPKIYPPPPIFFSWRAPVYKEIIILHFMFIKLFNHFIWNIFLGFVLLYMKKTKRKNCTNIWKLLLIEIKKNNSRKWTKFNTRLLLYNKITIIIKEK